MDRVERMYYPNGNLQQEVHYRGTKEHGAWRRWHPNGILAEEYWFEDGIYVNTVNRSWDENGTLRSEVTIVNCQETGRLTVWSEDGSILYRHYAIDGRKVGLGKYQEACKARPELPRYDDVSTSKTFSTASKKTAKGIKRADLGPDSTSRRAEQPRGDHFEKAFHESLLASVKSEAMQWLKASNQSSSRNLGDMHLEDSIYLVTNLYEHGAIEVLAVQIEIVPGVGDQTTNHLLLRLPLEPVARQRLFALENEHAESAGFDGESDHGQDYLYFKLS